MKNPNTLSSKIGLCCVLLALSNIAISQTAGSSFTTTDVPRILSYQGLVRALDGRPISDGQHSFVVSLYSDEGGRNLVWSDIIEASTEQGIFNMLLGGTQHPLPSGAQLNRPMWVGISYDGEPEMRPLSQLVASPYALNVADKSVTSEKLQDSAVTAAKMGTDYVAGIAVNGIPVTARGGLLNLVGAGSTSLQFDRNTNSIIVGAASMESPENADSAGNGGSRKGKGEKTLTMGNNVIEGSSATGGTLTMWQTPGTNSSIYNSSVTDNGSVLATSDGTFDVHNSAGVYQINGITALICPSVTTFVGLGAGANDPGTGANTALGFNALTNNSSGQENTAIGTYALLTNQSGDGNVAVGREALHNSTTSGNTAVGWNALESLTTGDSNTAIGHAADVASTGLHNAIALGYGVTVNNSDEIQLGNSVINDVATYGHIRSELLSALPTPAVQAGAGTGATASLSTTPPSTDVAGILTLNTGTGTAAGTQVIVSFYHAYANAPIVVLTANNQNAGSVVGRTYVTSTTTGFTINFGPVAAPASTTMTWFYHVIETQ